MGLLAYLAVPLRRLLHDQEFASSICASDASPFNMFTIYREHAFVG